MSEVINLDDYRGDYLFAALAICLNIEHGVYCHHRWIAGVPKKTSLFMLECPQCKSMDSFASLIPWDYLDAFLDEPVTPEGGDE